MFVVFHLFIHKEGDEGEFAVEVLQLPPPTPLSTKEVGTAQPGKLRSLT